MRKPKYRVWDNKAQQMLYFDNFKVHNTGGFWEGDYEIWQISAYRKIGTTKGYGYLSYDFAEECEDVVFMQCTGLIDKHGKDIYEGDIVNIGASDWTETKYKNQEVYWDEIGFYPWTETSSQVGLDYMASRESKHIEIIGNIYEKPKQR